MNRDWRLASLDVVNLYGSIPFEDDFSGVISTVDHFFENYKLKIQFTIEEPVNNKLTYLDLHVEKVERK